MQLNLLNCFLITACCLSPREAFACEVNDDWPDLGAWICAVNESMSVRDINMSYSRKAELITNKTDITAIRASVQRDDDETCRRYLNVDLDQPFERMLTHLSLPISLFSEKTEFAAAEVWNASEEKPLVTCEVQQLVEGSRFHRYINLYYFKFGPVRRGMHFIVRIVSLWPSS